MKVRNKTTGEIGLPYELKTFLRNAIQLKKKYQRYAFILGVEKPK